MPELPELHGMANVINFHSRGRVFVRCTKSSVHKLPGVKQPSAKFIISAKSRGKELMMKLQPTSSGDSRPLYILCNMGMTGFFEGASSSRERHKHAHLSFHATDGTVLSYVDARRFGTWRCQMRPEWPEARGPDPVGEHAAFRRVVVAAVAERPDSFASKPICQVLHDQSLFNGIGNYLRAEILLRAGLPPFTPAKAVLERLTVSSKKKDLLTLCRDVPREVIKMRLSKYQGGKAAVATDTDAEHSRWERWLRVYGHRDASWAVDKEGRRIWFRGAPGKLLAKCSSKKQLRTDLKSGSAALTRKRKSSEPSSTSASKSARKRPAAAP